LEAFLREWVSDRLFSCWLGCAHRTMGSLHGGAVVCGNTVVSPLGETNEGLCGVT